MHSWSGWYLKKGWSRFQPQLLVLIRYQPRLIVGCGDMPYSGTNPIPWSTPYCTQSSVLGVLGHIVVHPPLGLLSNAVRPLSDIGPTKRWAYGQLSGVPSNLSFFFSFYLFILMYINFRSILEILNNSAQ